MRIKIDVIWTCKIIVRLQRSATLHCAFDNVALATDGQPPQNDTTSHPNNITLHLDTQKYTQQV